QIPLVVGVRLGEQDDHVRRRRLDRRDLDVLHAGGELPQGYQRLLERLLDLGVEALAEIGARHTDAQVAHAPDEWRDVVADGLTARRRGGGGGAGGGPQDGGTG